MKYSLLVLACISAAAISFGFFTPYAIGNSINEITPIHVDLSEYDFNEDEFTGDAAPILNDVYYYP